MAINFRSMYSFRLCKYNRRIKLCENGSQFAYEKKNGCNNGHELFGSWCSGRDMTDFGRMYPSSTSDSRDKHEIWWYVARYGQIREIRKRKCLDFPIIRHRFFFLFRFSNWLVFNYDNIKRLVRFWSQFNQQKNV